LRSQLGTSKRSAAPPFLGSAVLPQIRASESKGKLTRSVVNPQRRIGCAALMTEHSFTPRPSPRSGNLFGPSTKSPAEAVADILELRKGVRLGGLKIKDLIHEGHKY